jgi:HMG box factor
MDDSSIDVKRRRYNDHDRNTTRQEMSRPISGGLHGPSQYPYPPPAQRNFHRRGSPPPPPLIPYHASQESMGRSSISPAAGSPRSSISGMGPPPRTFASTRNGLHAYPPTPLTAQNPTDLPLHPRRESETLRLLPLISPGSGESRSVEAMVKSMPYLAKIKLLRRIANPHRPTSPASPGFRVRGSIITVEGDDKQCIESVLRHLADSLQRFDDFDVQVLTGPKDPNGKVKLMDFLHEVAAWHEKTREMISFITGVKTGSENASEKATLETSKSQADSRGADKMDVDDGKEQDLGEGEVDEAGSHTGSQDSRRTLRSRELERKGEEMQQSIEHEHEKVRKIPLLLISNYILHASDVWASAIPIDDAYSPSDHWQWVATLWRGIVGADITIYVKGMNNEEPKSAISAENWSSAKPMVEIRDDIGALIVKTEKEGKVDDGAVRRVAFEVGEWVRACAANASKDT